MSTEQEYIKEFTADQQQEINEGLLAGLDVSIYARPELLSVQMKEIRLGLLEGLPMEKYAGGEYDWFQLEEIRKGMESGIDVGKYAEPSIAFDVMRQIRYGLEDGIDLSKGKHLQAGILKEMRKARKANLDILPYIRQKYDEEQLREIRIALEKGVDIVPYLSRDHLGMAIREICIGLEASINVSLYAKTEMSWQQMREIRLGLERRLDVSIYTNSFYSWQQMREIRLGMEENLPVSLYGSLMYTAKEMHKKRHALLKTGKAKEEPKISAEEEYQDFSILISDDRMEAFVVMNEKEKRIDRGQLMTAMRQKRIMHGIDHDAIDSICEGRAESEIVVIARGTLSTPGKDGWYEYFFETDVKGSPKLMEDGSVDYQNVKWFDIVQRGQKVAFYHHAENGKPGYKVSGEMVVGPRGKELKTLNGKGFVLLPDRLTYVAEIDGKIELKGNRLEITNVLILDDVTLATGNVEFSGSVYVRGSVGDGAVIKAEMDILVDGFIESAVLEAGGDIIIKSGTNAGGKGYLKAGGDVLGNFFENARITATGDIKANYCLNSELYAEDRIVISGKDGVLAGGRVYAALGIEAGDIGNEAGVATRIKLGRRDSFVLEEAKLLEKENQVEHELTLLKNAYFDFQRKYTPESRNNNPIYLKLENAIYTKELETGELLKAREKHEEEKQKYEKASASASGTIFQGVSIDINGTVWNAKPVTSVVLKKQGNRIALYANK